MFETMQHIFTKFDFGDLHSGCQENVLLIWMH